MSQETENTVKAEQNQTAPTVDRNSILNSFKGEFATSVIPIYVNSLKRTVNFREVSVKEQKTLSKTMIQNENRKDIVYDTQCALINKLCLEENFDIYTLTEFDRIRILMEIYSTNYIQNDIEFKCPECGTLNKYRIDFERIISRLNEFDLEDGLYSVDDKVRTYNFKLNYPTVYCVSQFYRNYIKQYRNTGAKEREMLDNMGNIEYVNLFIKNVEFVNRQTGNRNSADTSMLSMDEIQQILSFLPQNIMFDEKTGVLQHITKAYIERINEAFQYEKCAQCGYQTNQGIGDIVDFF